MRKLFRLLRITVLLAILIYVAGDTWLSHLRATDWEETLWVAIYPINGEGPGPAGSHIRDYIHTLDAGDFDDIEDFFAEEAASWDLPLRRPVEVVVAPEVYETPPTPPVNGNVLAIMWWSLRFRFWAWRMDQLEDVAPDIRIFVVYHTPVAGKRLAHSVGLEKGLLGIANVFADTRQAQRNNVVIAHEILHTLGATDKYDERGRPVYPQGYAEPDRKPLHPQLVAEIMAGRIPKSLGRTIIPPGLDYCVIGEISAQEINWLAAE